MIVIMFQLLIIYILLKDKIINTNDDDEPIIFNNICRAIKKWKEMQINRIKSGGKIISVEGKLDGNISRKIIGKRGFGYDPIFIPLKENITLGQMYKSKKVKMDHRFLAFMKLKKKIKI